jgi:uncharacterized protein DUF3108
MRRLSILAVLMLTPAGQAAAGGETLKVDYAITLAGLPLGNADLASTFEGGKYQLQLAAKLTGLAGMLTGGKGAATASGAVASPNVQPASFALTSRTTSDRRTIRMGMAGGGIAALEVMPPLEEKADRVPLEESHKRGVLDPVSALVMPVIGKDVTDPANCNRTLPIFDGGARFDIVLSYGETKRVEKPGYSGPVLVCNARYVPVAGHRALRPATKFMEENKDMSVWLAPVPGARVLVPLRIAVRTMIGMSVVEASQWNAQPEGQLQPAVGRPVRAGAGR